MAVTGQKGICTEQVPFCLPMTVSRKKRCGADSGQTVFSGNQNMYQFMKGGWEVGKKIIEKGGLRVRWLLLCAALRSFWQELLQQPKQTEYIRSRHRRRARVRKAKRGLFRR